MRYALLIAAMIGIVIMIIGLIHPRGWSNRTSILVQLLGTLLVAATLALA